MNKGRVSWGIVTIFVGVYILAYNLGFLNRFQLKAFLNSWPLLFVVWGLDLIIPEKYAWLQILLVILISAFAAYFSVIRFRFV